MNEELIFRQTVTYATIKNFICKDHIVKDSIERYCLVVGIVLTDLQKETFRSCIVNPEYLVCWSRRMSKTWLGSHIAVFFAVWGLKVAWRAAAAEYIEKPKEYWGSNPLVTRIVGSRPVKVFVLGEFKIHASTLSISNNRGGEYDVIIFDEEAFVPKATEDLLKFSLAMLKNSFNQHKLHMSTPRINTPFHFNFTRLSKIGMVSHHNYLELDPNISWLNIASITEDKKEMPTWMFNQEYLAEFVSSTGTIFTNLLFEKHYNWDDNYKVITHVGLDFHPGQMGTIYVGIHYNIHDPDNVWVVCEGQQLHENGVALTMLWLTELFHQDVKIGAETGGQNDKFYKAIRHIGKKRITGMSTNIRKKYGRIVNFMGKRIHMDRELTPKLFNDMTVAVWDVSNQIRKSSHYPNHYLDAFINSLKAKKKSHGHVGFG